MPFARPGQAIVSRGRRRMVVPGAKSALTIDTITMDSAVLIDRVPGFVLLFAPIDARLTALGA